MCFRPVDTKLGAEVSSNSIDVFGKENRMEITKSRPVGITIIAILLVIQGGLEIIYALLALVAAPGFIISTAHSAIVVQLSPWGFLISGIVALVLAYGLWTLRTWAFWGTVVLEFLNLIGGTVALFSYYFPFAVLLSLVIPAVILIYFCVDANVRSAFNL